MSFRQSRLAVYLPALAPTICCGQTGDFSLFPRSATDVNVYAERAPLALY
ncbi:hypothetical protein [Pseudobacillus wudalianchiensis]|nr:hypothetical protein [Bacillus wudalianchiensis]